MLISNKKNKKTLQQKRKKRHWWTKSKHLLEKTCNMESKYNNNTFLNLTFCSRFCILFYCICLLFFVTLALLEVINEV